MVSAEAEMSLDSWQGKNLPGVEDTVEQVQSYSLQPIHDFSTRDPELSRAVTGLFNMHLTRGVPFH